ncbi:PIN domain-containing protein [Acidianus sp. HS-5]|uniref:type II toxin-antitoxin system VapC family toxin n=1 Tax=Acidianus sp. HS-5 TaxID=2886040 RepID=UPI001F34A225|nr:PIN domain-containing protein [Acidianus sp. HS-5]BDC19962.1 hypothetical protein HS5_28520 [Acidianus sp. HS-5]
MIISKKITSIEDFIVTESVLQEFTEFIHEKYVELTNQKERALGYVKLFRYIIQIISTKPLVIHSYQDYLKAVDLAVNRNIDITDALLAITAVKFGGAVLTRDKDFERVKDIVKVYLTN